MADFTSFTPIILFTTFIITFQNLLRYAKAKDANGVVGILLAFLVGFGAVELGSWAALTQNLVLVHGQPTLGNLDTGSLIALGIGIGSLAPVTVDFFKSRDQTQTAKKPPIVGQADPNLYDMRIGNG